MKIHRKHLRDRPKMFASLAQGAPVSAHIPSEPVATGSEIHPAPVSAHIPSKPRTAEKMGNRYMRELGRLGGKANISRHGAKHMATIGRKGGAHPKRR